MKNIIAGGISIVIFIAVAYTGYAFYEYRMRIQAFAYTAKGLSAYAIDVPATHCRRIASDMNASMTPDMIRQRIKLLSAKQARMWNEYFKATGSASAQEQQDHFVNNHILDLQLDAYKAAASKPFWKRQSEFSQDLLNTCP